MIRHVSSVKPSVLFLDFLLPSFGAPLRRASSTVARGGGRPIQEHDGTQDKHTPESPSYTKRTRNPQELIRKIRHHVSLLSSDSYPTDPEAVIFNHTVTRLRSAFRDSDVDTVIKSWKSLNEKGLARFLGPPHLQTYSVSIADLYEKRGEQLKEAESPVMESIALTAAAGDATEGLCAVMSFHLRLGDAKRVLELHKRYVELSNWTVPDNVQESGEERETQKVPISTIPESIAYNGGKGHILLAAVAAHVLQGSVENALRTALLTPIKPTVSTVVAFLRGFSHDASLRAQVEQLWKRLEAARLAARPPSLVLHLNNLVNSGNFSGVQNLYQTIVDDANKPNALISLDPSNPDRRLIVVSTTIWCSFISAFLRSRRLDLAERLWDDMLKNGVRPGLEQWNALLEGYGQIGHFNEALVAWKTMISQGIRPNSASYRAIISTLFDGLKPQLALSKFQEFEKTKADPKDVLLVYNSTLHGLLRNSMEREAFALFSGMRSSGPTPDIVTYNTLLHYHARNRRLKEMADLLQALTRAGLQADSFTYSTTLTALLKAGRKDAPELIKNLMKKNGVEPNAAIYTTIIDDQIRQKNEQSLRSALDMIRWMEQEPPEAQPNEITYTSVLTGIYGGSWLEPKLREECKEFVLERMRIRNIKPSKASYNILLKACLDNPGPEGRQQALSLYKEMQWYRISLGHDTWYIILRGLSERKDWAVAYSMVDEMYRSGFIPVGGVEKLAVRIKTRMARDCLFGYSKSIGFSPKKKALPRPSRT